MQNERKHRKRIAEIEENFWFCLGSGDSLYKNKISEDDLMRAWLHPELIEVSDD